MKRKITIMIVVCVVILATNYTFAADTQLSTKSNNLNDDGITYVITDDHQHQWVKYEEIFYSDGSIMIAFFECSYCGELKSVSY